MGKSILFLHGLGGSGDDWDQVIPLFEACGWRCEAPTLFQHLRTRQTPPEALDNLGFNDWIKASAAYAEHLTNEEGEKPLVIGHCIGGLVAQKLVEYGDVSGGVFISPTPDAASHITGRKLSKSLNFSAFLLTMRANNSPLRSVGLGWGMLNNVASHERAAIIENMRYESSRLSSELANPLSIPGQTSRVTTQEVNVPTMTITCGKDRAISKSTVQLTAANWTKAKTVGLSLTFPNIGHWPFKEVGSETMFSSVLEWANTVECIKTRPAMPRKTAKIISLSAA
ncbi:alpha/beta hydrolase [Hirschia litorea]|uniref:Alpha/beta hydrolase n=1 Tax=Hirschia litorea TaxID=1199156 RepID=A0ABW2ILV9_9PROT